MKGERYCVEIVPFQLQLSLLLYSIYWFVFDDIFPVFGVDMDL